MKKHDHFESTEWTVDEWKEAWTIKVGSAYHCKKCDSMVMVTKGGVGVLDPRCCDTVMEHIDRDKT